MAGLFKNKIIKEKIERYEIPDFEHKILLVKQWSDAYQNGELLKKNETQCEQAFNQDFFINILGYSAFPKDNYTIQPKDNVESGGGQMPDATLGYFNKNGKRVVAVVEIKDANTSLDKSQYREGNLSPIQQAFKYKPQYKECGFVIATNFFELRLFRDNQLDYEKFTLTELVDPKDDYFNFRKFFFLLNVKNFITEKGQPETELLLSAIRIEQEKITNRFYTQYKELRESLITDIVNNNKEIKRSDFYAHIVEKAQKIVDRIVFICFFEDAGLLPENRLSEVVEYAQKSKLSEPIWDTIKKFFKAVDEGSERLGVPNGYNGELFKLDSELDSLKISDAICKRFVELTKFDFQEDLSVNILGHIFEQSITDLERLKKYSEKSEITVNKKDTKRKKDGIFYTPEYIVDYIVKNSLGKYLQEKEQEILQKFNLDDKRTKETGYNKKLVQAYSEYSQFLRNVKVLDPACGSGAFLVKVFDYLLAEHKRVFRVAYEAEGSGSNASLLSEENYIKPILENNIYGVDLNPESVEITKLSLWLKSAQKGQKLTTLKGNIKCGNSLIDDPKVAKERAFSWSTEFAPIMDTGGFDVVVGNPPYVSYYSKQSQADNNTKNQIKYYINHYDFISDKEILGRFNTVMFFFEKSIKLLKRGGFLGFIVDTNIHSNPYFDTRKYIYEKLKIHKIVDELKAFEEVGSSQLIVVGQKETPCDTSWENLSGENVETIVTLKQEVIKNSDTYSLKLPKDNKISDIVNKIKLNPVLSDLLGNNHIRTCITFTGKKDAFIHDKKMQEIDYPLLEGSSGVSKKYSSIKWSTYIRYDLELRDKLNKEYTELAITNGKRSPMVIGLGDLEQFKAPKIFIRLSDKRITATFTDQFVCADLSLYSVTLPNLKSEDDNFYLKYILANLNSSLITFYAINSDYIKNLNTGTPQIRLKEIRNIPIIKIPKDNQKIFVEKVDVMLVLTKEFEDLLTKSKELLRLELGLEKLPTKLNDFYELTFDEVLKISKAKLSLDKKSELMDFFNKKKDELQSLNNRIVSLDQEIDELIYKIYGLTPEEVAVVESFKKNV